VDKNECTIIARKHEWLKKRLQKNLQKQILLEHRVCQQFEKLRKLEIALEKCKLITEVPISAINDKHQL